jgi:hypothetical protein
MLKEPEEENRFGWEPFRKIRFSKRRLKRNIHLRHMELLKIYSTRAN